MSYYYFGLKDIIGSRLKVEGYIIPEGDDIKEAPRVNSGQIDNENL